MSLGRQSNSHCDWEDIAGRRDGHASAEHHLLAVAVQHTLVWVPGYRQGESDVYFFMGFPAYTQKHVEYSEPITDCYRMNRREKS